LTSSIWRLKAPLALLAHWKNRLWLRSLGTTAPQPRWVRLLKRMVTLVQVPVALKAAP
jgi:hypothetical protein